MWTSTHSSRKFLIFIGEVFFLFLFLFDMMMKASVPSHGWIHGFFFDIRRVENDNTLWSLVFGGRYTATLIVVVWVMMLIITVPLRKRAWWIRIPLFALFFGMFGNAASFMNNGTIIDWIVFRGGLAINISDFLIVGGTIGTLFALHRSLIQRERNTNSSFYKNPKS